MPQHDVPLDTGWKFCLADDVTDRSVAWTGWERHLLGFDDVADADDCVNWLKAGRCYGPAAPVFDDSAWRGVTVPHDWSVEHTPSRDAHPRNGFHPAGVAWYRKTLTLGDEHTAPDRRLALRFDGVFRDCTVFVNGHLAAQNRSGYVGFTCDISDVVTPGDNLIAVRVNATAKEGWFYEGAGIYRHVWLSASGRIYAPREGLRIDSELTDANGPAPAATIAASAEIVNDTDAPVAATAHVRILSPSDEDVASAETVVDLAPGETRAAHFDAIALTRCRPWSLKDRAMYTAHLSVRVEGRETDAATQRFGLRSVRFDADRGFFLNGERIKLKGVNNHQDHAGVGMAIPDALQRWRLRRLKDMGCNALRTAHNPPTPELLDLCDELGLLVMDEIRCFGTSEEAVSQLERTVRRDRHHPSVIMWSLANEEMAVHTTEVGRRMFAKLKRIARLHDQSRPFTSGINNEWDNNKGFIEAEDVHGINYLPNASLDKLRAARPDLPVIVTEASSAVSTRGEYVNDPPTGVVFEYDVHRAPEHAHVVNWPFWGLGAEDSWKIVAETDFLAGTFVWSGFDYRGEQSPYVRWPSVASHFGILDLCGFPKDRFYYYKAWWADDPVLHLLPHWTWPGREGEIIDVWAYTNCPRVELFLNGETLGDRAVEPNGHAEWKVEYRPGTLEAVGKTSQGAELRTRVDTVGPPHAVRLRADRPGYRFDGRDVALVTAEIVDAHGRRAPHAANTLRFTADGPGDIIGLGNGDPNSHENDTPQRGVGVRRAFHGLAQVIVRTARPPGELVLRADSEGLHGASLPIVPDQRPAAITPDADPPATAPEPRPLHPDASRGPVSPP